MRRGRRDMRAPDAASERSLRNPACPHSLLSQQPGPLLLQSNVWRQGVRRSADAWRFPFWWGDSRLCGQAGFLSDLSLAASGALMSRRPRRNHRPAFKAKVALTALGGKPADPPVDVTALHAKIGAITLENNFWRFRKASGRMRVVRDRDPVRRDESRCCGGRAPGCDSRRRVA